MKKFTIIYNDNFQIGSNWNTLTKLQRLTAKSVQSVMSSPYGENIQFIFDGWPLMENEVSENGYNLPIVELHY